MMNVYESANQPVIPAGKFYRRLGFNVLLASVLVGAFLCMGTIGYRYLAPAAWIDAFHNASMILSGMGPVIEVHTYTGKVFSSLYAIFSGIAFVTNVGLIITPLVHRFLHKLHVREE